MKKKILSVILSVTMVLSALACMSSANITASAAGYSYERDTTWYDSSASVLQINDVADFMEFMYQLEAQGTADDGTTLGNTITSSSVSWNGKMPFEGQIVTLNTDIILNAGIRFTENGPSNSGAYCFVRDGKEIGFGGIFDGKGHTISGLYISATTLTGGSIFGVAGAALKENSNTVTVRNLQIKNSYITSTESGLATIFASVPFMANARIENVYSNAYLHSQVPDDEASLIMGGLCAVFGGRLYIDNCAYAGTMSCSTAESSGQKKVLGGFLGMNNHIEYNGVYHYGVATVNNSAFYGNFARDNVRCVGKVLGANSTYMISPVETLKVYNCILAGEICIDNGSEAGTVAGCASANNNILIDNTVVTSLRLNNNVVTDAVGKVYNATVTGSPIVVNDSALIGDGAIAALNNGFDSAWVDNADVNGYPLPASLVDAIGEENLKNDFVIDNDNEGGITDKNEVASSNVSVNYVEDPTVHTVYSVDVLWDDIDFTYNTVAPQWDPELHEFVKPAGQSGWSDANGKITVVNHSNTDVNVEITFEKAEEANGSAKLNIVNPSFTLVNAVGSDIAGAPKKTVKITASGTPKYDGIIGKISVTIN